MHSKRTIEPHISDTRAKLAIHAMLTTGRYLGKSLRGCGKKARSSHETLTLSTGKLLSNMHRDLSPSHNTRVEG